MKNVREARSAMKGLTGIRKELEKEKARLAGSAKTLRKHARAGTLPEWTPEAMKLYRTSGYSYLSLLKLLRKNNVL